jgi:hypothetical protein
LQSAEYLVVIEVLNRTHGRDRERMYRALRKCAREEVDAAIDSLEQVGVVTVKGQTIQAGPALTKLGQLNLIGI